MVQAHAIDQKFVHRALAQTGICLAGACFLALMSQLAITLPFTPIPVSLETLALFLLAGCLGGQRAAYSVLIFLVQGSCGLPVFAGGVIKPLWWLAPQAGYLLAFVPAVFVMGKMVEKNPGRSFFYHLLVFLIGEGMILSGGLAWLSFYVGVKQAVFLGILPFLSGDALKMIAAVGLMKGYRLARSYVVSK